MSGFRICKYKFVVLKFVCKLWILLFSISSFKYQWSVISWNSNLIVWIFGILNQAHFICNSLLSSLWMYCICKSLAIGSWVTEITEPVSTNTVTCIVLCRLYTLNFGNFQIIPIYFYYFWEKTFAYLLSEIRIKIMNPQILMWVFSLSNAYTHVIYVC